MAGALTISTLNDSSGVLATQNGMKGVCKAWVNFYGITTPSIRASFNVSSITRNASGDYTLNFTTAMPDANYVVSGVLGNSVAGSSLVKIVAADLTSAPTTMTTSAVRVGTNSDVYICTIMIVGN